MPWGYSYDPKGKRVFAETVRGGAADTTCEIYFYGITGEKLGAYTCWYNDHYPGDQLFYYSAKSLNVSFGGKPMRLSGKHVVNDRLGSVRANSSGETFKYYPYGEERTPTADGREKFGTYFRDPDGVDYADQRYYAVGSGRFMTPDPYISSGGLGDPESWNRYSYVQGDPVNFRDRQGLFRE